MFFFFSSQELEENVVYKEKEDEFDVVVDSGDPEGHRRKAEKEQQEQEAIVSIDAIDTVSLGLTCTRAILVFVYDRSAFASSGSDLPPWTCP